MPNEQFFSSIMARTSYTDEVICFGFDPTYQYRAFNIFSSLPLLHY